MTKEIKLGECLIKDYKKTNINRETTVELRLYNHETGKAFYKKLTLFEYTEISRLIGMSDYDQLIK